MGDTVNHVTQRGTPIADRSRRMRGVVGYDSLSPELRRDIQYARLMARKARTQSAVKPEPVSGLAATPGPGSAVRLSWTASASKDVYEYQVWRKPGNYPNDPSDAEYIGDEVGTRHTDVTGIPGEEYTWYVKAIDNDENASAFSTGAVATVPEIPSGTDKTPPDSLAGVGLSVAGYSLYEDAQGNWYVRAELSITGLPVDEKRAYVQVKHRRSGSTTYALDDQIYVESGNAAAYVDDLLPNVEYEYAVVPVSYFGVEGAGKTVGATTPKDTQAPATPVNVVADGVINGVSVASAPADEDDFDEYELYVSTTDGFSPTGWNGSAWASEPNDPAEWNGSTNTLAATGKLLPISWAGGTGGRTYYIRLVAKDKSRNRSAPSTEVSAVAKSAGATVGGSSTATPGPKAPMPRAMYSRAIAVVNGVLHAVGGQVSLSGFYSDHDSYDPTTNTWTARAPIPWYRGRASAGAIQGYLYVVGGLRFANYVYHNPGMEMYNPTTNVWTSKPPLPTPRVYHAAGVVDDVFYVVGGDDENIRVLQPDGSYEAVVGGGIKGTNEAYSPVTNTWTTKASMGVPRTSPTAGAIQGILYVVGGNAYGDSSSKTNEAYNPVTNTWTSKAPMPEGDWSLNAGVIRNTLYTVGTTLVDTDAGKTFAYNPHTNSWSSKASPTDRSGPGIGVINEVLYAVGGRARNPETLQNDPVDWNEAYADSLLLYSATSRGLVSEYRGRDLRNTNVGTVGRILSVKPGDTVDMLLNTWNAIATPEVIFVQEN